MIENHSENPGAVIIDGHGHTDLGVVRALGRAGVPVYLVSNDPRAPVWHSRHIADRFEYPPDSAPDEEKIATLRKIGQRFRHPPVLFSTGDNSLMLISRNRTAIEPFYRHHLADEGLVEQLNDKRQFAELAEELGLPVPRTLVPRDRMHLVQAMTDLQFPVMVKPTEKKDWARHPRLLELTGGNLKGVRIETPDALLSFYDEVSPLVREMVIQHYIEGRDESLYSLYVYLNRRRELKAWGLSQKIRTSPPHRGVGTVSVTRNDPSIYDLGRCALMALGVTGLAILQVKWSAPEDSYLILEVNARHGTSISLYPEAGVNLPYIAYQDSIGVEPEPAPRQREGVRWIDIAGDLRAMPRYREMGEWTWLGMLRSYMGPRTFAVFSWEDPVPALRALWNRIRNKSARVAGRLNTLAKL